MVNEITRNSDTRLPIISVGIITYNRKDELIVTISKILESNYPNLEIIVVDNASLDNSYEIVKSRFPGVLVQRLERNMGAAANNHIFSQASGKYIILYNDDSAPATSSTIKKIVDFLESHSDIAALCTNVINYYSQRSETPGGEKYALNKYTDYYETLIMHGAGIAFRTESIRETRGFPEDFFICGEESDLVLQMVGKNLRIAYKQDIITCHRTSPANRDKPWRLLMFTRNGIWLFWKYFSFTMALYLSLAYTFGQFSVAVSRGKPVYLLFFFKGVYEGVKGIITQRSKGMQLNKEAIRKTRKWRQMILTLHPMEWIRGRFNSGKPPKRNYL